LCHKCTPPPPSFAQQSPLHSKRGGRENRPFLFCKFTRSDTELLLCVCWLDKVVLSVHCCCWCWRLCPLAGLNGGLPVLVIRCSCIVSLLVTSAHVHGNQSCDQITLGSSTQFPAATTNHAGQKCCSEKTALGTQGSFTVARSEKVACQCVVCEAAANEMPR